MGRYDKIKVYHNGSWKTPTSCRVYYNGSWRDLGDASSYNTNTLYTRYNNSWVRVTLNRRDTTRVTDRWAQGTFNLIPKAGWCYCPNSSSSGQWAWYFRANVTKLENTDQNIFYCGKGTPSSPSSGGGWFVQVTWLANGKIRFRNQWNGNTIYTHTSEVAVQAGQEIVLNVYTNKGSDTNHIVINGVDHSHGGHYGAWRDNRADNTVGDTNIQFRGTLSAAGVDGSGDAHSCSFDTSTVSGTDGSHYKNVQHYETTVIDTDYV